MGDTPSPLDTFAASLERYGIDKRLAPSVAGGIILRLRQSCWRNMSDIIGDARDLDRAVGLGDLLPPESLAKLMHRAKLLGVVKGFFFMPSAYAERPEYVNGRWVRRNRKGLTEAMGRANRYEKDVLRFGDPVDLIEEVATATDLFGKPIPKQGTKGHRFQKWEKPSIPGYHELVAYWSDKWHVTEGRKLANYPFGAHDGNLIKKLLDLCEDIEHVKRVMDCYLSNGDRFYAGKTLKKLVSDLPRFIGGSDSGTDFEQGQLPYAGAADELPDIIPP